MVLAISSCSGGTQNLISHILDVYKNNCFISSPIPPSLYPKRRTRTRYNRTLDRKKTDDARKARAEVST